ncbi:MAG: hypothetical protein EZS28_035104 [Streblomastix strix]|uniref:RSE1/DDB1/CPSF1 first beta-propeller domain-containing protein n=1 Tax=Streblomastix strix TaxID=222440 RepID=A0A5J4UFH7_9EUKA|nr:MAG: hypothetical protein EZS28_035104 [Streblomastix strix]
MGCSAGCCYDSQKSYMKLDSIWNIQLFFKTLHNGSTRYPPLFPPQRITAKISEEQIEEEGGNEEIVAHLSSRDKIFKKEALLTQNTLLNCYVYIKFVYEDSEDDQEELEDETDDNSQVEDDYQMLVSTIIPPGAVIGSCLLESELNSNFQFLIIAKVQSLEIYRISRSAMIPISSIPINGRISVFEKMKLAFDKQESVVVLTQKHQLCIFDFDEHTHDLVTKVSTSVLDLVGRKLSREPIVVIDPQSKMIVMHIYQELLKIIPLDSSGRLREAFNVSPIV